VNALYCIGGEQQNANISNILWCFSFAEQIWHRIPTHGNVPVAVYGSVMSVGRWSGVEHANDVHKRALWLFGGHNGFDGQMNHCEIRLEFERIVDYCNICKAEADDEATTIRAIEGAVVAVGGETKETKRDDSTITALIAAPTSTTSIKSKKQPIIIEPTNVHVDDLVRLVIEIRVPRDEKDEKAREKRRKDREMRAQQDALERDRQAARRAQQAALGRPLEKMTRDPTTGEAIKYGSNEPRGKVAVRLLLSNKQRQMKAQTISDNGVLPFIPACPSLVDGLLACYSADHLRDTTSSASSSKATPSSSPTSTTTSTPSSSPTPAGAAEGAVVVEKKDDEVHPEAPTPTENKDGKVEVSAAQVAAAASIAAAVAAAAASPPPPNPDDILAGLITAGVEDEVAEAALAATEAKGLKHAFQWLGMKDEVDKIEAQEKAAAEKRAAAAPKKAVTEEKKIEQPKVAATAKKPATSAKKPETKGPVLFQWADLSGNGLHATGVYKQPAPHIATVNVRDRNYRQSDQLQFLHRHVHVHGANAAARAAAAKKGSSVPSSPTITPTAAPKSPAITPLASPTTPTLTAVGGVGMLDELNQLAAAGVAGIGGAGRKQVRAMRFNTQTALTLPNNLVLDKPYTVVIVDKYVDNGMMMQPNQGRTLQSKDHNWLLGRWKERCGHFASGWVPDNEARCKTQPGEFAISVATMDHTGGSDYYQDGVHKGRAEDRTAPGRLAFGKLGRCGEPSDADVATVMIWNRVLTPAELQTLQHGLAMKYGIDITTGDRHINFPPVFGRAATVSHSIPPSLGPYPKWCEKRVSVKMRAQWVHHASKGAAPARIYHSVVAHHDGFAVWGGQLNEGKYDSSVFGFRYTDLTWRNVETMGTLPPPRYGHSMGMLGGRMVLYGGKNEPGDTQTEVYICDLHDQRDMDHGICMEMCEIDAKKHIWVYVVLLKSAMRARVFIHNRGDVHVGVKLGWHSMRNCEVDQGSSESILLPPGRCEAYAVLKITSEGAWNYEYKSTISSDDLTMPLYSYFQLRAIDKPSSAVTYAIKGGLIPGRRKVVIKGIQLDRKGWHVELKRSSGNYVFARLESKPLTQQIILNSKAPSAGDEIAIPPTPTPLPSIPAKSAATTATSIGSTSISSTSSIPQLFTHILSLPNGQQMLESLLSAHKPAVVPAKTATPSSTAANSNASSSSSSSTSSSTSTITSTTEVKVDLGTNRNQSYPLAPGQRFTLEISATPSAFVFAFTKFPDGEVWRFNFMHRLPYQLVDELIVDGEDIIVTSTETVESCLMQCTSGCKACMASGTSLITSSTEYPSKPPMMRALSDASFLPTGMPSMERQVSSLASTSTSLSLFDAVRDQMGAFRTNIDPNSISAVLEDGRSDVFVPILQECMSNGDMFTDPFFPAQIASLGEGDAAKKVKSWRRPNDYCDDVPCLVSYRTDPCDVVQGELGDCMLILLFTSYCLITVI
jgi:hypothetical protein